MADELHEIMRALGRLEEGQERQRADFDEEKSASRDSRDAVLVKLEKIEVDVGITGAVAAQARDATAKISQLVLDDVKPATDDYKRMRSIGKGTIWAVGIAAAGLGVTLATAAESVINAIRAWLRIP